MQVVRKSMLRALEVLGGSGRGDGRVRMATWMVRAHESARGRMKVNSRGQNGLILQYVVSTILCRTWPLAYLSSKPMIYLPTYRLPIHRLRLNIRRLFHIDWTGEQPQKIIREEDREQVSVQEAPRPEGEGRG